MTYDVVVLGEVLVELAGPWHDGAQLTLGFSGDALNAAAAAAAAGAHVALLARVAADELGDELVASVARLGVDTSLIGRSDAPNGVYFVHSDPAGEREFVYSRRGSAGSSLGPDDLPSDLPDVVLASGIACAISASAAAAVHAAASRARRFVYDPNFRGRLTTAVDAAAQLRALAPHAELVTPSAPTESAALVGLTDPVAVAEAVRGMGARHVAVTCGADGVWLDDDGTHLPAVPPPRVVDQTGAGDVFAGTVAARLALGDSLVDAARLGTAAASLALGGAGGCGAIPTLEQSRAHLDSVGAGS